MSVKSAELQDQISNLDLAIQQGATDAQLNLWEMQRKELQDQLKVALEEESAQQTATESAGFVFDGLEVDGLTAPEIITDDNQYKLIRKGVQILVGGLITDHSKVVIDLTAEHELQMKALGERALEAESKLEKLQAVNKDLEVKNYELGLENDELSEKVRKVAELQHETNQIIEQQKQHIAELQNQIAIGVRGALNVVNMPQDTSKLAAEIIASKPRITNVRFKDKNGIDTRVKKAEYVLTGETFEYEALYEKRYIILNAEQAEQYRADEANKKAEQETLQAAIPTLVEPDVLPVNDVTETDEAAAIQPFPESNQVDANTNGENTAGEGNRALDEVVAEESKVAYVTRKELQASLITVFAVVDQLTGRVSQLESEQRAVA